MIHLDNERLHSFLRERKDKINGPKFPFDGLFSLLTFLFTLLTVEYNKIKILSNSIVITFFWLIFILYLLFIIYKIVKAFKSKYTTEDLYHDIIQLQKETSSFSLLTIRDNYQNHNDRFLLLYDKRWKCYLLPYFSTSDNEQENQQKAIDFIRTNFSIAADEISIKTLGEKTHTKYSVSNERTKTYKHTFYEIKIHSSNAKLIKKSFKIYDKRFKWFSIAEMQNNKRIMSTNSDVIEELRNWYR